MGSVAFRIGPDGKKIFCMAGHLQQEDCTSELYCGGWSDDEMKICGAPVGVVEKSERMNEHFRRSRGARPHIKGCPFDEKRKMITVEMLDRGGRGKTTEDIFNRITKDKKKREKPPKGGSHPPEGGIEPYPPVEECEEDEREIRTKKRHPQTVQELVMVLKSLNTTDYYADKRVFDQILDERTIAAYRGYSLPIGKPFIITTRKTSPYSYFLENNQWALVDYWSKSPNAKEPFVFIFTVTPGAKKKLYNLCQMDPAVKILVYAKFKRHPTLKNAYISELVKAQMITVDPENNEDGAIPS